MYQNEGKKWEKGRCINKEMGLCEKSQEIARREKGRARRVSEENRLILYQKDRGKWRRGKTRRRRMWRKRRYVFYLRKTLRREDKDDNDMREGWDWFNTWKPRRSKRRREQVSRRRVWRKILDDFCIKNEKNCKQSRESKYEEMVKDSGLVLCW